MPSENKKKIDIRSVQLIQLDMLKTIAAICDQHNIRYYLAAGTLLGAVRHQGFIPWDDDLDIQIPRPDYNRLLQILDGGVLPKTMEYAYLGMPNHHLPFLKLYYRDSEFIETKLRSPYCNSKIWIDVFPLDGLSSDAKKIRKTYFWATKLRHFLYTGIVDLTQISGIQRLGTIILRPIARVLGSQWIAGKIESFAQRYDIDSSPVIGNIEWARNAGDALPTEQYLPQVDLQFEDGVFHCPKGYHEHLTNMYGDYMIPPPEHLRAVHSSGEFYLIQRDKEN